MPCPYGQGRWMFAPRRGEPRKWVGLRGVFTEAQASGPAYVKDANCTVRSIVRLSVGGLQ